MHSLEFVLDAPSDAWVRAEWASLDAAGLPSQTRHQGATNAPHVTLASAAVLGEDAVAVAVDVIAPLLPVEIELAGVVLLGRGPYALARLLTPGAPLLAAVDTVRRHVRDPHSSGWLAHLTLARRLPVDQVGAALGIVATGADLPRSVTLGGL